MIYKDNYIFPAIISKNVEGDYIVKFPDFNHIFTYGEDINEAYLMAEDALKLELFTLYEDKLEIPTPTDITNINHSSEETLMLVKVSLKEILRKYDNTAVKKTLTIPSWLNKLALEHNINFSQVLQIALEEKLNNIDN